MRQGRHGEAGMLMTIMCGGLWGEDRRFQAGYRTDNLCQACNSEPDTDWHRAWGCPYYCAMDHDAVKDSMAATRRSQKALPKCTSFHSKAAAAAELLPCSADNAATQRPQGLLPGCTLHTSFAGHRRREVDKSGWKRVSACTVKSWTVRTIISEVC